MSLNDPLSNVLSKIICFEKLGRRTVIVSPISKSTVNVLKIMNDQGYIGTFKENKDVRGGTIEISLLGKVNKCGVIKPRYNVKKDNYKKFEKRFLPAFGFGYLIVSTTQGIMTHEDALKKELGGKLIAYVY